MTEQIQNIEGKIIKWRVIDTKNGKISIVKKERPKELDGRTYALKSPLLKSTLYITINNIEEDGKVRPFEVFFNTRDSAKFVELQIITRLMSAILRRSENAAFLIDELKAVANPENTGYFRPPREGEQKGVYIPSIFYEIGEVIEEHFNKLGIKNDKSKLSLSQVNLDENNEISAEFMTGIECPQCHEKTLKRESGCDTCLVCGYSKCG